MTWKLPSSCNFFLEVHSAIYLTCSSNQIYTDRASYMGWDVMLTYTAFGNYELLRKIKKKLNIFHCPKFNAAFTKSFAECILNIYIYINIYLFIIVYNDCEYLLFKVLKKKPISAMIVTCSVQSLAQSLWFCKWLSRGWVASQ